MPHLQRLPDELLYLVISNLISNRDIAALSVQFRRARRICDLATRRRYRRIRIRKDEHLNSAFDILLLILRKPHLGAYVRHLEIDRQPVHSSEYRKVENADFLRSLSENDFALVEKVVKTLPFTGYDQDTFLNMVLQRKIDISPPGHRSSFYAENTDRGVFIGQAIAVLLMSVCPALESLVLGAPFRIEDGLVDASQNWPRHPTVPFPLDMFIRSVSSSSDKPPWHTDSGSPYLQGVRKIEFLPRPYLSKKWYSPCDINTCIALTHGLPNLQAISVDGMKPIERHARRLVPNKIQRIELHRSFVGTELLLPLICGSSELRKFTYTSGYVGFLPIAELDGRYGHVGRRAHENESRYTFNSAVFIGCILRHRETLESLELDCDYQINKRRSMADLSLWLQSPPWSLNGNGSLKDFTALTCLDVGVHLFFQVIKGVGSGIKGSHGSDVLRELPPKLRYLTLRGYQKGDDPDRDSQLEGLDHGFNSGLHACLEEVRGIHQCIPMGTYALRETWLGGEDPDFKLEDWTDYDTNEC